MLAIEEYNGKYETVRLTASQRKEMRGGKRENPRKVRGKVLRFHLVHPLKNLRSRTTENPASKILRYPAAMTIKYLFVCSFQPRFYTGCYVND